MKRHILLILSLVLLVASIKTNAQVLITKNDSIPLGQDSIVKIVLAEARGSIQWQKSMDTISWINMESEINDTLVVKSNAEAIYRAVVTNGTCLPVHSDTARVIFLKPKVITDDLVNITHNSASISGNVTSDGGAAVTSRGVCWSTSQNPTVADSKTTNGTGTGSFTADLTGLTSNTTYYARAYATNSKGTGYGNEVSFTTEKEIYLPEVTTTAITAITQTTATSGGNVTSDGGAAVTSRGVCWSTSQNPTTANSKTNDGTGTGSFTSYLTGLTANTPYYVRAYAINSQDTAYGSQVTFTTSSNGNLTGTFTDSRDGRTYNTVIINGQEWMAENLTYLPAVSPSSAGSITEPYYYVYGYEGTSVAAAKGNANYTTYGVLYNWPAAKAASPSGWHLPTDDEWKQLEKALGMTQATADGTGFRGTDQGTQMKATSGWDNNGNGTNTSGFSALPGGYRHGNGDFYYFVGTYGGWWSSTQYYTNHAWYRVLYYYYSNVYRDDYYKDYGFSVRCVRD